MTVERQTPRLESVRLWLAPPAIKKVARCFTVSRPRVLDVGCGFGAARKFTKFCPRCEYSGLDRDKAFLLPDDVSRMHRFYEADLETSDLSCIPDGHFDAIILSHVIEHLRNGEDCLRRLVSKLKSGGVIYVEYPGVRSLAVPHATGGGFLHFHDDPTHVRLYSVSEVVNTLLSSGCQIVSAGTRRDAIRLLLSPFLALRGLIVRGSLWSGRLWDLYGIAEFVMARKV